jgi:hypothetical protein
MALFERGEKLILLRFERGRWDALDAPDRNFVESCIGREVTVGDIEPEEGRLIEAILDVCGTEHEFFSIWVEPSWVKRVNT